MSVPFRWEKRERFVDAIADKKVTLWVINSRVCDMSYLIDAFEISRASEIDILGLQKFVRPKVCSGSNSTRSHTP